MDRGTFFMVAKAAAGAGPVPGAEAGARRVPFPPVVLGIAGCSGSGKTTLALELARTLDGVHFSLDNYYLDLAHLPPAGARQAELRRPGADREPAAGGAHFGAVARTGHRASALRFATYTRVRGQTETVRPGPMLLVEGLFALHYPVLLPLYRCECIWTRPTNCALSGA